MTTRQAHVVRITDPNDSSQYVDVKVIDTITYVGPDGVETCLDVRPANVNPLIIDDTGSGLGRFTYNPTRKSHIEVIRNPDDSTQFLAVEVLDALSFDLPNGEERILWFPKDSSNAYVTNGGFSSGSFTRAAHRVTVSNTGTDQVITVQETDSITYHGPNGAEMAMVNPRSGAAETLVPSGYTPGGTVTPPPNSDLNPYVKFVGGGPWLGKNVFVDQGPLWEIVNASARQGPWYWWVPVQQPYEWSQDTLVTPELSNNFAEAVWVSRRLPNIGCDYGMFNETVTTGPDAPLAPFGYASLEAAIFAGEDPVNGFGWGVLDLEVNFPKCVPGVSGTPDIWDITGIPNLPQIPPPPGSPPGTAPTDQPVPPALAAQVATAYATQWNQTTQWCNDDQAALDGTTRIQYVDYIYYSGPNGTTAIVRPAYFPYPRTAFHVPLGFPVSAPNFGIDTGTFIGGIPAAYWFSGGELWIFQPAYATYQNTGQLDPKRWDTSTPANPIYIGPTDGHGNPLPP
jgi:hypothetical protein